MANLWDVTDKEIQALWSEIWPKIVAIAWLDHYAPIKAERSYRRCFERDRDFRKEEVKRIADILRDRGMLRLTYRSEMPICIEEPRKLGIIMTEFTQKAPHCLAFRNTQLTEATERKFRWSCPGTLYGETFFYLNHTGIILPWPDPPDLHEIFIGYLEGGGSLPRNSNNSGPGANPANLWPGSVLTPTESDLYEQLIDFTLPEDCEGNPPGCSAQGLSGIALLTLFDKWGEVMAGAWTYPGVAPADIDTYLEAYIMPEVWSEWPSYLKADVHDEHNFVIQGDSDMGAVDDFIEMYVPVPDPPSINQIFQELIVGSATNPMYSNCY